MGETRTTINGKNIEFPDGMPPAQIEAEMRKLNAQVKPKVAEPSTVGKLFAPVTEPLRNAWEGFKANEPMVPLTKGVDTLMSPETPGYPYVRGVARGLENVTRPQTAAMIAPALAAGPAAVALGASPAAASTVGSVVGSLFGLHQGQEALNMFEQSGGDPERQAEAVTHGVLGLAPIAHEAMRAPRMPPAPAPPPRPPIPRVEPPPRPLGPRELAPRAPMAPGQRPMPGGMQTQSEMAATADRLAPVVKQRGVPNFDVEAELAKARALIAARQAEQGGTNVAQEPAPGTPGRRISEFERMTGQREPERYAPPPEPSEPDLDVGGMLGVDDEVIPGTPDPVPALPGAAPQYGPMPVEPVQKPGAPLALRGARPQEGPLPPATEIPYEIAPGEAQMRAPLRSGPVTDVAMPPELPRPTPRPGISLPADAPRIATAPEKPVRLTKKGKPVKEPTFESGANIVSAIRFLGGMSPSAVKALGWNTKEWPASLKMAILRKNSKYGEDIIPELEQLGWQFNEAGLGSAAQGERTSGRVFNEKAEDLFDMLNDPARRTFSLTKQQEALKAQELEFQAEQAVENARRLEQENAELKRQLEQGSRTPGEDEDISFNPDEFGPEEPPPDFGGSGTLGSAHFKPIQKALPTVGREALPPAPDKSLALPPQAPARVPVAPGQPTGQKALFSGRPQEPNVGTPAQVPTPAAPKRQLGIFDQVFKPRGAEPAAPVPPKGPSEPMFDLSLERMGEPKGIDEPGYAESMTEKPSPVTAAAEARRQREYSLRQEQLDRKAEEFRQQREAGDYSKISDSYLEWAESDLSARLNREKNPEIQKDLDAVRSEIGKRRLPPPFKRGGPGPQPQGPPLSKIPRKPGPAAESNVEITQPADDSEISTWKVKGPKKEESLVSIQDDYIETLNAHRRKWEHRIRKDNPFGPFESRVLRGAAAQLEGKLRKRGYTEDQIKQAKKDARDMAELEWSNRNREEEDFDINAEPTPEPPANPLMDLANQVKDYGAKQKEASKQDFFTKIIRGPAGMVKSKRELLGLDKPRPKGVAGPMFPDPEGQKGMFGEPGEAPKSLFGEPEAPEGSAQERIGQLGRQLEYAKERGNTERVRKLENQIDGLKQSAAAPEAEGMYGINDIEREGPYWKFLGNLYTKFDIAKDAMMQVNREISEGRVEPSVLKSLQRGKKPPKEAPSQALAKGRSEDVGIIEQKLKTESDPAKRKDLEAELAGLKRMTGEKPVKNAPDKPEVEDVRSRLAKKETRTPEQIAYTKKSEINDYIKRFRSREKQQYALYYRNKQLGKGGEEPTTNLSYMARQAIRIRIDEILGEE